MIYTNHMIGMDSSIGECSVLVHTAFGAMRYVVKGRHLPAWKRVYGPVD